MISASGLSLSTSVLSVYGMLQIMKSAELQSCFYIDSTFFGAVWSNMCPLQLPLHMSSERFRAGVFKLALLVCHHWELLQCYSLLVAAFSAALQHTCVQEIVHDCSDSVRSIKNFELACVGLCGNGSLETPVQELYFSISWFYGFYS